MNRARKLTSLYNDEAFVTQWTVSGDATARTITLPLYNSGTFNCTVDWGDGSALSTITAYNDANRIHTYSTNGTYNVKIRGDCPSWSFNNTGDKLKIKKVLSWGDGVDFTGFSYLTGAFYGCTNLTSLASNKIKIKGTGLTSLASCFYSTGISSIPIGLFDNCVNVNTFSSTFRECLSLTSIPTDLFRYNTAVSTSGFQGTFYGCTSLTSIPADLFRYNTAVSASGFSSMFEGCTSITSIPTDLFRYNTAVSDSGFYLTFNGCTSLTSIPTDLFRYNTAVSDSGFQGTFANCSSLTTIPTDLFRYNTAVSTSGFRSTFYGCTSLTSMPEDLFRYNTNVNADGFYQTFYNCNKLQIKASAFYAVGEESTRFLNKSINFTRCFSRSSFTGTQGTAPDLWNCDFGTGTPTKTTCFGGAGNSSTSLSNYASIPADWR